MSDRTYILTRFALLFVQAHILTLTEPSIMHFGMNHSQLTVC